MNKFTKESTGLEVADDYQPLPVARRRILSPTVEQFVEHFHEKGEIPIGTTIPFVNVARTELRKRLIEEEYEELMEAFNQKNSEEALDAICDLAYLLIGTAVEFGWEFDSAFEAVHQSNMTKVQDGVLRREDGKILKGPNYKPPYLGDLV